MGLSGRLCNATPWDAKVPWHRSLEITVPGDHHVELTAEQLDDFRPGKPGSEEVRKLLEYNGCFLFDTDKSYDIQMLECINAAIREKQSQYNDFLNNLRNQWVAAGRNIESDDQLESALEQAGYVAIREKIEALKNRQTTLRRELEASGQMGRRSAPKYDMERTSFGVEPPREFATSLALKMFHAENAEAAERDAKFRDAMTEAATDGDA